MSKLLFRYFLIGFVFPPLLTTPQWERCVMGAVAKLLHNTLGAGVVPFAR